MSFTKRDMAYSSAFFITIGAIMFWTVSALEKQEIKRSVECQEAYVKW